MDTDMIVIARNYGQLGNRLVLAANLIAAARHYGVSLLNPSFVQYAKFFASTENDIWCRYPPARSDDNDPTISAVDDADELLTRRLIPTRCPSPVRREVLYRSVYLTARTLSHLRMTGFPFQVIRIVGEQRCDLTSESFRRKALARRPILVSGWNFDAGELLDQHAPAIREHFRILPEHQIRVDASIAAPRGDADVVVGVHIRQGDYKTFRGGRYYYSIDQYVAAMRRVRERLAGRRVAFWVCGNGPLDRRDFGNLNVFFGTGHLIEDLYGLAATDLLVGPPSTFTKWASFYGDVPLRWMETADEPFDTLDGDGVGANGAEPAAIPRGNTRRLAVA